MTTEAYGWNESASAWIASQGENGDFGRQWVLDGPMRALISNRGFRNALDVGCGEGRFCRIMKAEGIETVGIDPCAALIEHARARDDSGEYRLDTAGDCPLDNGRFDLAVCYLSLIDIPDLPTAIDNIVRMLRPGGSLLVANLTSFNSAALPHGWVSDDAGKMRFDLDHYAEERAIQCEWQGICIVNYHRPLSTYMGLFLGSGLTLKHFSEPMPSGGDSAKAERYRRAPWFHIMEWQKASCP